jgi:hypothetical protein
VHVKERELSMVGFLVVENRFRIDQRKIVVCFVRWAMLGKAGLSVILD